MMPKGYLLPILWKIETINSLPKTTKQRNEVHHLWVHGGTRKYYHFFIVVLNLRKQNSLILSGNVLPDIVNCKHCN